MVEIHTILGNSLKLDAGAMFGNAAKSIWREWITTDQTNRVEIQTRCLLVKTSEAILLFDTGVGCFMEPRYLERYGIEQKGHQLTRNLAKLGITPNDITHVILSHLHFDHIGGLVAERVGQERPDFLFGNAEILVSRDGWERAREPHFRDRSSFVPWINRAIEQQSSLRLINGGEVLSFDGLEIRFILSDGHTPGLLCSDLRWEGKRLVFISDLIPGIWWVHLPITTGYDRYPEKAVDEKKLILSQLVEDHGWLFFPHDPTFSCAQVTFDSERKRFTPVNEVSDQTELGRIFN